MLRLGLIGLGAHMCDKLLPVLQGMSDVSLEYGCCRSQDILEVRQKQYGFKNITTEWKQVLPNVDA
uniref:Gfo/Idh/MocA-like oxidoreductase N-terminal domain-containing protein n=1 Tax=viral metagenome TaxID=1070528 RepID=A0A6C0BQQ2_9ZZZZ